MIDALVGFVALLRHHGLDVGTDRTLAAARALEHTDLAAPRAVKRALLVTLVGHRHHVELFDCLFDQWFDGGELAGAVLADAEVLPHESVGPAPTSDISLMLDTERKLHDAVYVDDPSERIGVTTERRGERDRSAGPARAVGAPHGDQVRAAVDAATGVGDADGETARVAEAARSAPGRKAAEVHLPTGDAPGKQFDELLHLMATARRRRLDPLEARSVAPAHARSRSILANPFDDAELATLRRIVEVLRPQLVGAPAWRRTPDPTGETDLRRTLRRAVTTGGVPIEVSRRRPPITRPEVLLLVDTSLSMRPSVRLMLHLAHHLRARLARVRVLAFIDRCVDVTDVIRHSDLATALGQLIDDAPGGPLDPARSSDYGSALRSLWSHSGHLVRPAATVFVLGDGRSNGRETGVDLVAEITDRCRRTIWLTPEPRGAWHFGHGEMARYAAVVDVAWTVRSLDDLVSLATSGLLKADRRVT